MSPPGGILSCVMRLYLESPPSTDCDARFKSFAVSWAGWPRDQYRARHGRWVPGRRLEAAKAGGRPGAGPAAEACLSCHGSSRSHRRFCNGGKTPCNRIKRSSCSVYLSQLARCSLRTSRKPNRDRAVSHNSIHTLRRYSYRTPPTPPILVPPVQVLCPVSPTSSPSPQPSCAPTASVTTPPRRCTPSPSP